MIHVIETRHVSSNQALLDGMFRLRARVFRDKLGWAVTVRDGLEKDRFDEEDPVYIINTDETGFVNGSCRLLPTTGPTLIEEAFADTLPDIAQLSAPSIWECTRLCVDRHAGVAVSGALIAAIGQVAISAGIETILGNFDATMLHIYRRLGCDVTVLGSTKRYGRPVYLGSFPVRQDVLDNVLARLEDVSTRLAAA
jgi:N-acyl-L-homoserine lactone synthetase